MAPPDLLACLVQDVHQLLLHNPGMLLRLPTSTIWGLAPYQLNNSTWYAVSPEGCAMLAVRRRPWVYMRGAPDLSALASEMATRLKHAELPDRVGQYLFDLSASFGPSGRSCILAHGTSENFPWISTAPGKPALSTHALALDPQTWEMLCNQSIADVSSLLSGGGLPAPEDAASLLVPTIARFIPEELITEQGMAHARARLLESVYRERARITILRTTWSSLSGPNPYRTPPWLESPEAEAMVDRFLAEHLTTLTASSTSPLIAESTRDVQSEEVQPRPRRPSVVSGIHIQRSISDSQPDDFRGGTGAGNRR